MGVFILRRGVVPAGAIPPRPPEPDRVPDDFAGAWPPIVEASLDIDYFTPVVTLTGFDTASPFACAGGLSVQLDGAGPYLESGTCLPGQTLGGRLRSSALNDDLVTGRISFDNGALAVTWSVTTKASTHPVLNYVSGGMSLKSAMAAVPVGNSVELVSVTGAGMVQVGVGRPVYVHGSVLAAPGPAWSGAGDSGYAEIPAVDPNVQTFAPGTYPVAAGQTLIINSVTITAGAAGWANVGEVVAAINGKVSKLTASDAAGGLRLSLTGGGDIVLGAGSANSELNLPSPSPDNNYLETLSRAPAPALRLIVPWNQQFADDLTLLFQCEAAGGVDRIEVMVEGNTYVLTERRHVFDVNVNGCRVIYRDVYALTLDYSAAAARAFGVINLYARAFARDPTMSTQLIGQRLSTASVNTVKEALRFFVRETLHDKLVWIDPTQPVAFSGLPAGVDARFQSVQDAVAWLGGRTVAGSTLPKTALGRIVVKRSHVWTPTDTYDYFGVGFHKGGGYHWLECDPGVTITIGRTAPGANNAGWLNYWGCVRFKGKGVIFDQTYDRGLFRYASPQNQADGGDGSSRTLNFLGFWLDGCVVSAQNNLRTSLGPFKDMWDADVVVDNSYGCWFITNALIRYRSVTSAKLVTNTHVKDFWVDASGGNLAVVGNAFENVAEGYHSTDHPAMRVEYVGPRDYAGLRRKGDTFQPAAGFTHVLTLETSTTGADGSWSSTGSNGLTVDLVANADAAAVVAAINADTATHGFKATQHSIPDDGLTDRNMRMLTKVSWNGSAYIYWAGEWNGNSSRVLLKADGTVIEDIGGPAHRHPGDLITYQDVHSDIYQSQPPERNRFVVFNISSGSYGAQPFNTAQGEAGKPRFQDFWAVNNSYDTSGIHMVVGAGGKYQHWTWSHNHHAGNLNFYVDTSLDRYSTFGYNNVNVLFRDPGLDTTATAHIDYNVCLDTQLGVYNDVGTVVSGDVVGDRVPGLYDFDPESVPQAAPVPHHPDVTVDITGALRPADGPAGPKNFRTTSAVYSYAEAQDLFLCALFESPRGEANTFNFRYRAGPGETGAVVDLPITVDVGSAFSVVFTGGREHRTMPRGPGGI